MPAYPVVKSGILRLAPNAGYHRRRMCLHVFGAIVRQSAYESFTSKPSWKYLGNASDQRALPDESYSVYPLWWAQPSPINLYPVCVFSGDVFNTIDARSAPLPTPHCSTRCAPSMSATKKDLLPITALKTKFSFDLENASLRIKNALEEVFQRPAIFRREDAREIAFFVFWHTCAWKCWVNCLLCSVMW